MKASHKKKSLHQIMCVCVLSYSDFINELTSHVQEEAERNDESQPQRKNSSSDHVCFDVISTLISHINIISCPDFIHEYQPMCSGGRGYKAATKRRLVSRSCLFSHPKQTLCPPISQRFV